MVILCIDFRLQHYLNDWLTNRFGNKNYDRISVAGAIKDFVFVIRQVEISHRLHKTRKAILINHENCWAYGRDGKYKRHVHDLTNTRTKIKAFFPSQRYRLSFYTSMGPLNQFHNTPKKRRED